MRSDFKSTIQKTGLCKELSTKVIPLAKIFNRNFYGRGIEDNGIGREKAKELNKKKEHLSVAINITKERLTILSGKFKYRFKLEIIDLKNKDGKPEGTLVKFVMPCKVLKR